MSTAHPSDEVLSAHLDGEAVDLGGHDSCASCQGRLAALDSARQALRAAVVPPPDLAGAVAVAADHFGRRDRAARPRMLMALAAAAVVAVLLAAIPVALSSDKPSRDTDAFASGGGDDTSSAVAAPGLDAGDLGAFSDPQRLRDRVAPLMTARGQASGNAAAGQAAPTADAATEAYSEAPPMPATRAAGAPEGGVPCVGAAREQGFAGALIMTGTVRWKGARAVVVGFHMPERRLPYVLLVMTRGTCQLLVTQTFS